LEIHWNVRYKTYLRGCARSRGRLSRLTLSCDQGTTFFSLKKCPENRLVIDLDLVSSEGSSIVTGATSPTPSVREFESSQIDFVLFPRFRQCPE
jgi:hypothetical protein